MYRYSGCHYPYPHRLTGDGHAVLMAGMRLFEHGPRNETNWDDDEDEILISMYRKNQRVSYIADILDRTEGSIMSRKLILQRQGKLEKRSNIQVNLSICRREFIKRHYTLRGLKYCVYHLGLSKKTVQEYARRAGIKTNRQRNWTTTEIEFLRTHYADYGFEYCAHKVHRSLGSVRQKACELNLTQPRGSYDRNKIA